MAASVHSEDGDLGFQIAPMVDVVFVLLLFFMAVVGVKELMLPAIISSPGAGAPTVIRIDITEAGVISANDTVCGDETNHAVPELRSWLKTAMSVGAADPVVIHPAPGTRQERIIDVLNACAAENVKGVSFN
ncbi:MAG TPA: biopolymer transporter ExbD [Chthoniobacteraceae bacterium]|jgi:biopolymer transport protein ExbD|nr:biopolymer transporter ExbD [Chthoniobacteraceae bacterium]